MQVCVCVCASLPQLEVRAILIALYACVLMHVEQGTKKKKQNMREADSRQDVT